MRPSFVQCIPMCMLLFPMAASGQTLGTGFMYQGQLEQSGAPFTGTADFECKLFTALSGGTQIGATLSVNSVTVADGRFTISLNFGAGAFNGAPRFLEIAVRSPAGSGPFTTLSPRQAITATPYALYALSGPGSGGPWAVSGNNVFNTNTGNVGVGTTNPGSTFHVFGEVPAVRIQENDDPASFLLLEDRHPTQMRLNKVASAGGPLIDINPMPLDGTGNAHIRFFRETNTTGLKSLIFHSGNNSNATSAVIGVGGNPTVFQLDGGNFGIGTPTPVAKLDVRGGAMLVENLGDQADLLWLASERSWVFRQEGTGATTALKLQSTGGGGNKNFIVQTDGFVGIGTSTPSAKLDVNGTTRTSVLEVTGADLAEKFPASEKLEPGMVVAIDKQNPGQLCLARGAYNPCVAGVVSGANDFPAGAILGSIPGREDGPPIALSGRVYVWCDASNDPIEPGDMLTSSEVPGHAMKANDRDRSHGAVIGKAMTALGSGRGTVLVLVNLQ